MNTLKDNMNFSNKTLSEIVADNFQTATVFEKYSLDFCCNGNKTINEACKGKNINSSDILSELEQLKSREGMNFADWNPGFLSDYIVNNHHNYVRKMIPVLSEHTKKIASVHGKNHPELLKVLHIFEVVYKDLKQHMMKEEQMLFPFIKNLEDAKNNKSKVEKPFFGTVKNPIRMMQIEHESAGDEMAEIRNLTGNYSPPDEACNTYKVTFMELKAFEEDLHKHVFLENSILFPKAVEMETELLGS